MNDGNFKICPYCAEQVKAAAKVCPRCRQWLSIFSLRNPGLGVGAFCLLGLFLTIFLVVSIHHVINRGIDFLPYRGQISVVESRMFFATNQNTPYVYIVGIATNQSSLAWNGVEFEARFFNKAGTLIDVGSGYNISTIYPQKDSAFRIRSAASLPFTEYDSYTIYVGYAHDPLSRF